MKPFLMEVSTEFTPFFTKVLTLVDLCRDASVPGDGVRSYLLLDACADELIEHQCQVPE